MKDRALGFQSDVSEPLLAGLLLRIPGCGAVSEPNDLFEDAVVWKPTSVANREPVVPETHPMEVLPNGNANGAVVAGQNVANERENAGLRGARLTCCQPVCHVLPVHYRVHSFHQRPSHLPLSPTNYSSISFCHINVQ